MKAKAGAVAVPSSEAAASVAMASMAMAAQWMTAKQVAVLKAAVLQRRRGGNLWRCWRLWDGEAHSESGGSMGGKGEGGASGDVGGDSRLGTGEKQISLHGVADGEGSRRSSSSFRRFLGFFTGGGALSGDDTGSAGCGAWTAVESAVGGMQPL